MIAKRIRIAARKAGDSLSKGDLRWMGVEVMETDYIDDG